MNYGELLRQIRSRGHWQIVVRPLSHQEQRLGLPSEARNLVEGSTVHFGLGYREFPHFDAADDVESGNDYVQLGTEYWNVQEFWRCYVSGQFAYYSAYVEDREEVPWRSSRFGALAKPSKYLEIVSTLYQITEAYEFAARFATAANLSEGLFMSITLTDTKDRDLIYWKLGRHLRDRYICRSPDIVIGESYSLTQIRESRHEYALRVALEVFDRFGWHQPPVQVLKEDQRRLIERRA